MVILDWPPEELERLQDDLRRHQSRRHPLQGPGPKLHPPDLDFRTPANPDLFRREGGSRTPHLRLRHVHPDVYHVQPQELPGQGVDGTSDLCAQFEVVKTFR